MLESQQDETWRCAARRIKLYAANNGLLTGGPLKPGFGLSGAFLSA